VNIKSRPYDFFDISATCKDFCVIFCKTIRQPGMHFMTKFSCNILENYKIMLFQPRQSPFLGISSVVFIPVVCWWLWKEPVCRWWDEDADLETDRLLQMLVVTTIGSHSHVASQALEVRHRLVDVVLWQLCPDGLQSDFQLIGRLRLRPLSRM